MKVRIHPALWNQPPCVRIPPSKSMAHRAIMCASLAGGKSTLHNVAYSDDILATISGMCQFGAHIETLKDSVKIEGTQSGQPLQSPTVDCNESGSTLRFLIPIFTRYLCWTQPFIEASTKRIRNHLSRARVAV